MSPTHLLIVLLVVVLVFGTKKLPELGRDLGSAIREFKGGITATGSSQDPAATLDASTASARADDQPAARNSQ